MTTNNVSDLEENPFQHLQLESHSILDDLKGRSKCSECKASRKYFCYTCLKPVDELHGKLPQVELPVKIDIIKHHLELDGKSTAVHALVLAPKDVNLFTYPCIPEYDDPSKVLLVYPSSRARTLQEILSQHSTLVNKSNASSDVKMGSKVTAFDRVVFIDSTWYQSKQINNDERLRDLPCVVLPERKTNFWRTQNKDESYLATIEAIYYFLLDLHELTSDIAYDGQFDNLLYFFVYMYRLVKKNKAGDKRNPKS